VPGLPEELRKQARAWAKASCADQGLAVLVTDPGQRAAQERYASGSAHQ